MQNKTVIFSEPFAKTAWLQKQVEKNLFHNVSFQNGWMPLTQVKNQYPFFIDEQFNISPDLSKRFIPFFDYINVNQTYEDQKLIQLQTIKKKLIEHQLIKIKNLSNSKIVQLDYGFVPKYLSVDAKENVIQAFDTTIDCYQASDVTEQVYAVFETVTALLNAGININEIKIMNTTDDDDFQLKKRFLDANIPLFINKPRSIRAFPIYRTIKTLLLDEGLEATKTWIEMNQKNHPQILKPIIHLINRYADSLIQSSMTIFIKELEQLRIQPKRLQHAVEIMKVDQIKKLDHHYLMMNFVDESFPTKQVDHDYLTDHQKAIIGYPTTDQINRYRQQIYGHLFDGLAHLTLFYPAKLVDDTRLSTIQLTRPLKVINYQYHVKEKSYLKDDDVLRFGQLRYLYEQYKIETDDYPLLSATHADQIEPFNHQFKGIHQEDLDQLLKDRFSLTGAKIEKLNLCPFQYFLTHLLRLDDIEPNHYIYFGNQIHEALEHLVKDEHFDVEKMVHSSTTFPEDIGHKKSVYQAILIENIHAIYQIVKDFHQHALYQKIETEKEISRKINPQDRFHIKGIIDKLMIDEENGYYAIVDYKYSGKTFSINEFEQGLKLQLPFYAYLYGHHQPLKPTGIFFRQTGLNREKSGETQDLKMDGVFIDNETQMLRLDPNANHIKGLRYKNSGGLYKNSSKLSEPEFRAMIERMETMIIEAAKQIERGDFKIKPILTIQNNHHSISCQYCPYGHICYSKNKHIKEVSREVYDNTN